MPVSKKRKKDKERRSRPRDRGEAPGVPAASTAPQPPSGGGGLLTRMRGGFQNLAGTGAKKKESLLSKIITWAIVLAAAYFVARRFGLLP